MFSEVEDIHLDHASASESMDSMFSQGGLSEQWRERIIPQVIEGVMEKRESIVYHPGFVESLAKRVSDNPPP